MVDDVFVIDVSEAEVEFGEEDPEELPEPDGPPEPEDDPGIESGEAGSIVDMLSSAGEY